MAARVEELSDDNAGIHALGPRDLSKLAQLASLAGHYADPEFSVSPGGHVRTIAAGHYTVSGLSRHVRLGEFVAHRSATGIHLGEVVRVEPDICYVCPIEPGEPIGIHDTVIRRVHSASRLTTAGAGAPSMRLANPSTVKARLPRALSVVRFPTMRRLR